MTACAATSASPEGEVLDIRETAAALKCSIPTVRRLIQAGTLPAARVGTKLLRIRRSDLDALLTPIDAGGGADA